MGGYAFYYLNQPRFFRPDAVLRLAVAPVYMDGEVGLIDALGPRTDLGVGFFGGGFARSHYEMRGGHYFTEESFIGHGVGASVGVYRRFNPGSRIPLSGVLRSSLGYCAFVRRSELLAAFELPPDHLTLSTRGGVRYGGQEPMLKSPAAMELSAWYEAQVRDRQGNYGLAGDRGLERDSHFLWGRALLAYADRDHGRDLGASLTAGASLTPDRLNTYRLGGSLPLTSEFPLSLPGYNAQELSARRFALLDARYGLMLGPGQRFGVGVRAAGAYVDYLPGMGQAGSLHAGVGTLLEYESVRRSWKAVINHGYGVAALRSGGRGAHSISLMFQCNLRAGEGRPGVPSAAPPRLDQPFFRFLDRLKP